MDRLIDNSEKQQFKEHYEEEAEEYDKQRDELNPTKLAYSILQKSIVSSYLDGCNYILEAGCGTGKFTIDLAQMGKRVVAVDISFNMLKQAEKKARLAGVANRITFIQGDIENIPCGDGIFDGILSVAVLRHMKDSIPGITSLSRSLRRGGVLVIDYLNANIFKFYEMLGKLAHRKLNVKNEHFFTNYYSTLKEIKQIFSNVGIEYVEHHGIVKIPNSIVSALDMTKVMLKFEKAFNFGSVVMVKGIKSDG